MDLLSIVTILTVSTALIHLYMKWSFSYWKCRNVPYQEPSFFFGNAKNLLMKRISMGGLFCNLYKFAKNQGQKHAGAYFFQKPLYVPVDLELIKNILQKDFDHFVNHGMFVNEEVDPLTGNLFNLEDDRWRNLRVKLTPTFTSGIYHCHCFLCFVSNVASRQP